MTKTERIVVSTEAGRGLSIERVTPKMARLITPTGEQVFFWDGKPFAAFDQAYCYTYDNRSPGQWKAIQPWTSSYPVMTLTVDVFEHHMGQILSKAGLMLVRRLDP